MFRNGQSFFICERKTEFVNEGYGTTTVMMTTDMVVGGMMRGAEVMKKGDDADALIGKVCVHGFHLSVNSEGVHGKTATKTVMGVTACGEVGAFAEVGEDAVCSWTADFPKKGDDLFFNVFHDIMILFDLLFFSPYVCPTTS